MTKGSRNRTSNVLRLMFSINSIQSLHVLNLIMTYEIQGSDTIAHSSVARASAV